MAASKPGFSMEVHMKRLTIGMPVYNGATTIEAALDSLLAQTLGDFDLVISDNGSSDGTQAICEAYAARDDRVRYVRQPVNLGPQMNFRYVLFEAQTPYFMWAAADDLWAPLFAERNIAALEADEGLVMSQSQVVFTENGVATHLSTGTYALSDTPRRNAARFFQNPADNSRYYGVFRTEALKRSYPTMPFHALDWAVSAGTLRFGKHHEIPEPLMIRDSSDPASYARAVMADHRFWLWRMFPVLFMTRWIIFRGVVPLSPALLYRLFRLNLYMHFRFGLYKLGGVAERYLASNSLMQALGLGRLGLGAGLGGRLRRGAGRVARGVWRRLPLTLEQRQGIKARVFRGLGRGAAHVEAFQGWSQGAAAPLALPMPSHREEWQLLATPPEAPVLSVVVVGEASPGGPLLPFSRAALLRREHAVEIIWVLPRSGGLGARLVAGLPGLRVIELEAGATLGALLNAGAAAATAGRVLFVPSTAGYGPELVPALIEALLTAQVVASQLRRPDGVLDAAGGNLSLTHGLVRRGAGESPAAPAYAFADPCDVAPGALAVTREALAAAEPFNPALDDFDLALGEFCLSIRHLHGRPLYWPFARVVPGLGTPGNDEAWRALARRYGEERWRALARRYGEERWRALEVGALSGTLGGQPMRVLYIDADTPQPDRNSGSIDAVNLMRLLRGFGARITFVPESNFAYRGAYADALGKLGIQVAYRPNVSSVREVLEKTPGGFDLVFLCRAYIADRYLGLIRELLPSARIVFYTVDLHFLREEREARISGDPALVAAATESRARELASIAGSDMTIVLSTHERDILAREVPSAQVRVLPLLRDIPATLTAPGPEGRRDILFIGTYQHPPNADAAIFFAREVWPLVRARLPGARFLVVGSAVTPEVAALSVEEGVEVVGFVQDLDALMNEVRVSVAPLRYGAGLKGKVASALQVGLPTVATTIAAEGVALTHGHDILIADTPAEIAEAVLRLHEDDALWRALASNGFDFVRHEYSLEANEERVSAMLLALGIANPLSDLLAFEQDLALGDPVFRLSRFWEKLAAEHLSYLSSERLANFKRSINNTYMQWLPGSFDDPRLKLPLANFAAHPTMLPVEVAADVPLQPELAREVVGYEGHAPFTNPGYLRFYAFYTGLVWQLMAQHASDDLHTRIEEPTLGGPIVLRRQGQAISQDLAQSLLEYYRVKELVRQIEIPARPTYLELGAGYGRLAYVFLMAGPCRYVIVDIPPTILVAKRYLSAVFPERRVFGYRGFQDFEEVREEIEAAEIVFLSPNQLAALPDGFFDVAMSISSLHEMNLEQIARYKVLIAAKTARAVYLKQWTRWKNPEDGIEVTASLYSLAAPWRLVLDSTDLANCEFTEQGWHRGPG
jgi:putative sugar O-methyltransferase